MIGRTTAATWILALAFLALAAGPAWAGDEGDGDSPAEQAFRAGWWAETSEGKLDRALEHYEAAVEAEGPATVRARALYRMGVVLHRIGRTQDAIQTLERLAKEHPGEEDLQSKARARLEEWTAIDLETNFDEWYRRYQYSPEFQARIVELVLALSSMTDATVGATAELLTIGAPAIPALRAHLDSSNDLLRGRVVDLLMKLGEVPGADALLTTYEWQRASENWALLFGAPAQTKKALLEALEGREEAELLRSVLGPKAGWADAYRRHPTTTVLLTILDQDVDDAVVGGLKALVGTFDDVHSSANRDIARALYRSGHASGDELVAWLAGDSLRVAAFVADELASAKAQPRGTLEAVVARMNATPPNEGIQDSLFTALVPALGDEPTEARLRDAVKAIERAWTGHRGSIFTNVCYSGGNPARWRSDRMVRFLEAVVDHAKDPQLVRKAMYRWSEARRGEPLAARRMLAWADAPLDPENRRRAAQWAGNAVTAETIDEALEAATDMEPGIAEDFWRGLETHRALQGLPWGDARLLELLSVAEKGRSQGGKVSSRIGTFLTRLLAEQHRVEQFVRLALEAPWRVPPFATDSIPSDLRGAKRVQAMVKEGFPVAWHDGNLKAKRALLNTLYPFLEALDRDEDLDGFFREQVRAAWEEQGAPEQQALQQEVKELLLHRLPTLDLEDVRAVYDLEDPAQAAAAVRFRSLPATVETYDALAAARRAEYEGRARLWNRFARSEDLALRRRVNRDRAEDPDPFWRRHALEALGGLRNGKDVDVLRHALRDESVDVREAAAAALAHVYDKSAIKALVRALEDDDPGVRDAVLRTLEIIKEIERKKEYWRRAVRNDGTMPSDD